MNSATRSLLAGLEYNIPDIRGLYRILSIEDPGTGQHQELSNILQYFTKPSAVIAIGITTSCFIVQRRSSRKYDVIRLDENYTYSSQNLSDLRYEIVSVNRSKDYIPQPLLKKIVTIKSIDSNMYGTIWTLVKGSGGYTNQRIEALRLDNIEEDSIVSDYDIVTDILKGMEVVNVESET